MSVSKHIKEHIQLGFYTNNFSVGPGQPFANLADAITARAAQSNTLLGSCTVNVTGTTSGTVDIRDVVATSSQTFLTNNPGKMVGVRLNDAGGTTNPLLIGYIKSSTIIEMQYPIVKDYTTVNCDVYEINFGTIMLADGYEETLTSSVNLPAFTVLGARSKGAAHLISEVSGDDMFLSPTTANHSWLSNLRLTCIAPSVSLWEPPGADTVNEQKMTDFGVMGCIVDSDTNDLFYSTANNNGGFFVYDTDMYGHYDTIKLGVPREFIVSRCRMICNGYNSVKYPNVRNIAIGSLYANHLNYPLSYTHVYDNYINSHAYDTALGGSIVSPAYGFDISLAIPDNAVVDFHSNHVEVSAVTGTQNTYGFAATSAAVNTVAPDILVHDNVFKVTNGGTGTAYALYSASADNVIMTGRNAIVQGGSTTTAGTAAITTIEI